MGVWVFLLRYHLFVALATGRDLMHFESITEALEQAFGLIILIPFVCYRKQGALVV